MIPKRFTVGNPRDKCWRITNLPASQYISRGLSFVFASSTTGSWRQPVAIGGFKISSTHVPAQYAGEPNAAPGTASRIFLPGGVRDLSM